MSNDYANCVYCDRPLISPADVPCYHCRLFLDTLHNRPVAAAKLLRLANVGAELQRLQKLTPPLLAGGQGRSEVDVRGSMVVLAVTALAGVALAIALAIWWSAR